MRAQCCICHDLFENCQVKNIAAAPCGHTFHEDCLLHWMETSSTCPSCRTGIKRNQIIKRLFFDIREDSREDEDVDGLLNQKGNLKAMISEKDRQRQELAESRDYFSVQMAAAQADKEELQVRLHKELNVIDILQRDVKLLRKENSAFVEEMKEFRKTQRRLQELQNIESILKGCDSDIQDVVNQYSESGESAVKQLASLLTVVKREYNQVLTDKKELREQTAKLKRSLGHYHSEVQKSKMETKELKADLEKAHEALSQVEKENNENRRKLVHLRNALRHNKTEGSQSFHRALNEDSPNVAYTPPKLACMTPLRIPKDDEENEHQNVCLTPDLFDESPDIYRNNLKRKCLEELDGPKLKLSKVPTAAERLQACKQNRSDNVADDAPRIPQTMLSILQKKLTGQSNSRAHVTSVITRGYDGFGGSEKFVHSQGQKSGSHIKLNSKKCAVKQHFSFSSRGLPNSVTKQPQISNFVQGNSGHLMLAATASSSLSSVEKGDSSFKPKTLEKINKLGQQNRVTGVEKKPFLTLRASSSSSSSSLQSASKLSSDATLFIDLT